MSNSVEYFIFDAFALQLNAKVFMLLWLFPSDYVRIKEKLRSDARHITLSFIQAKFHSVAVIELQQFYVVFIEFLSTFLHHSFDFLI